MRKQFTLTSTQFDNIVAACTPVRYMVANGMPPRSPQENANDAWCALGREMGFDGMSVLPDTSGDPLKFTAEVTESE